MHAQMGTALHTPTPTPTEYDCFIAGTNSTCVSDDSDRKDVPRRSRDFFEEDIGAVSSGCSTTLAVAAHCPPAMRRENWSTQDFRILKSVYMGQKSFIYMAKDKQSGMTVALKAYSREDLDAVERNQITREIQLHISLDHPSVIACYAAWKDKDYVYMALEWAPGGDLMTFVQRKGGKLREDVAVTLIIEPFLQGLEVVHSMGIIHRDIKPENILVTTNCQIKIADFGLSIDASKANTKLGTIDYLAPEILDCPLKNDPEEHNDDPTVKGYTNKVDCWSVGVLAYELLTGKAPFAAKTAMETIRRLKGKGSITWPTNVSPAAIDFMSKALARDPSQRPSVSELIAHPWIQKFANARKPKVPHPHPERNSFDCSRTREETETDHTRNSAPLSLMRAESTPEPTPEELPVIKASGPVLTCISAPANAVFPAKVPDAEPKSPSSVETSSNDNGSYDNFDDEIDGDDELFLSPLGSPCGSPPPPGLSLLDKTFLNNIGLVPAPLPNCILNGKK